MLDKRIVEYLELEGIPLKLIKGVAFKVDSMDGYSVHVNLRNSGGKTSHSLKFKKDKKTAKNIFNHIALYIEESLSNLEETKEYPSLKILRNKE